MLNVLGQIKEIARSSQKYSQQVESLFILMREFHWTIWEIQELPLPTMQIMFELMKKEARASKSKNRK